MDQLVSLYSNKIDGYNKNLSKVKKNIFYIAAIRVVAFIVLITSIYFYFKTYTSPFLILLLLSLIAFLWLVKKSGNLSERKKLLENLLIVNENELNILKHGKNRFDNGNSVLTNESYYADLDVFGENSLFHLLNRTSTIHGYKALSSLLKRPLTSVASITAQQKAVQVLAPQNDLRELIIAKALINKDDSEDVQDINKWLQEPAILTTSKYVSIMRFVLPVLNLIVLFICINLGQYYWVTLTAFISWLHVGYYLKYINTQHLLIGKKEKVLNQNVEILKEFEQVSAQDSSLLSEHKKQAIIAHKEIKKLSNLSNLLDSRLNILVNILLNSFFIYDIQYVIALEKWKQQNKDNFFVWINCVASIETLVSLSAFAFNNPDYCLPEVSSSNLLIEAKELAHPLIKKEESISNDISLGKSSKLLLITGSNMSGKTTFLRTVGINTLLAQCGAPVCAKSFLFTPFNIYTSIRISDSLQENTSYFMAELKRLSNIKNHLAKGEPSLVLIDEILRGTNSEDKYYGSAEFVKKLVEYNCLTLFATHDLKLSELEHEYKGQIENYCFESIILDDELKFDYKILKGVAQNKNASFLMKKMKII